MNIFVPPSAYSRQGMWSQETGVPLRAAGTDPTLGSKSAHLTPSLGSIFSVLGESGSLLHG